MTLMTSFFPPSCLSAGSVHSLSGALNVLRHGEARGRAHQPSGASDRQAVPGLQYLPGSLPHPQGPSLSPHLLREVTNSRLEDLAETQICCTSNSCAPSELFGFYGRPEGTLQVFLPLLPFSITDWNFHNSERCSLAPLR